jgi:hypothetical protein
MDKDLDSFDFIVGRIKSSSGGTLLDDQGDRAIRESRRGNSSMLSRKKRKSAKAQLGAQALHCIE